MALVSCSDCQANISDQASACPHCECPIKKQLGTENVGELSNDLSIRDQVKNGGHVWIWVVGIVISIPIVLIASFYLRNKALGPVGWAQDNTKNALKERMKDPDSMIIRSSYVVKKIDEKGDELIYVCGIVDGKNGFGGYAGGTRFASWSFHSKSLDSFDTISVQMEDPEYQRTAEKVGLLSGFDKVYWNEWCVDANHSAVVAKKGG